MSFEKSRARVGYVCGQMPVMMLMTTTTREVRIRTKVQLNQSMVSHHQVPHSTFLPSLRLRYDKIAQYYDPVRSPRA